MSNKKTEEGLENCPRQNLENEKTLFLWYVQYDKNVLLLILEHLEQLCEFIIRYCLRSRDLQRKRRKIYVGVESLPNNN
jgi:hypothetical protein